MQLTVTSQNQQNPLSLDLTQFLDVQDGEGMDPYNAEFTSKIFSHSLLKDGGTLALENLQLKEQTWPLKLNSVSSSAVAELVIRLNQIINTPGAVCVWQDDGMSQPTYFDLASGQFDIGYKYREQQRFWISGNLRLFSQPLGRTAAPRQYAAASGAGPLLLVSPYASSGAMILSPSAGGFGGTQQPGGGIFYAGSPSLAGDAPTLLQINYRGPVLSAASAVTLPPYCAVSVLPDNNYHPIIDWSLTTQFGGPMINDAHAVNGQYFHSTGAAGITFTLPASKLPTQLWAGMHRLFAIARASTTAGLINVQAVGNVPYPTNATVYPGEWSLYDLGSMTLRPSETIQTVFLHLTGGAGGALDVTAVAMLPEASTWFINPAMIASDPSVDDADFAIMNGYVVDDVIGDQFIGYPTGVQTFQFPLATLDSYGRITADSRGVVPRPEPYNGMPVIAILGVGAGLSLASNPQNQVTMAQVSVLERTRYVLP